VGGVVPDVLEAVPGVAGNIDEVARAGHEGVVAVEDLQLAEEEVEGLVVVVVEWATGPAPAGTEASIRANAPLVSELLTFLIWTSPATQMVVPPPAGT
jgi:hypothetical protein